VERETGEHRERRDSPAFVCIALAIFAAATAILVASAQALSHSQQAPNAVGARLLAGPLETGIFEPNAFGASDLAFQRTVGSGATSVRLLVRWSEVAPTVRDPGFRSSNPADPAYRWEAIDQQVRLAVTHGLSPIICIVSAPNWAEGEGAGSEGTVRPDPIEFGRFATAAARRYSGAFSQLPRVRYWQAWNEPNLIFFLAPQYVGKQAVSPVWYRRMVNAFSDAVHSVRPDNVAVAGGLAPFTTATGDRSKWGPGPLAFMRRMLCLSRDLRPTCRISTRFDVWAHNPYASGGPGHHATLPDDVSIADLPEMTRILTASLRYRRIVSPRPIRLWVTEFSWDTKPPDPKGVPSALHARWVAEALYRMWSSGVSLVTWFSLRDSPFPTSLYQSGLYFAGATPEGDRPKPALRAFRFPFVALPQSGHVTAWGRTPTSRPGRVLLQRRLAGRWAPLTVLQANRFGIFRTRIQVPRRAQLRAQYQPTGELSLPFRVVKTRDRPMYAFGTLPR
jgi:hypothetical protein